MNCPGKHRDRSQCQEAGEGQIERLVGPEGYAYQTPQTQFHSKERQSVLTPEA